MWQRRLRRFGLPVHPRTDVRARLVPAFPEPSGRLWAVFGAGPEAAVRLTRWAAWLGPLLVALFAGVLRFWNLGSPRKVIFDETYYPKDAWSLLQYGYEGTWAKNANDALVGHPPELLLSPEHSYVVHPPMGKWLIALGESVFGMNPFGWRFMVALLGTLSVLLVCRIGHAAAALDGAGLSGGRPAGGGRSALRDEPDRAAGSDRDVLGGGRVRLSAGGPGPHQVPAGGEAAGGPG